MNRALRLIANAAVAAAVVTTPLLVATGADAGPYDRSPVTVSDSQPAPGQAVRISAAGFRPNSKVTVSIRSTPVLLATVTADANGVADTSVQVPASFAPGSKHTFVLAGVDPAGQRVTRTLPVTLAGGSALPFTGVDAVGLTAAGLGLAGFGAFLRFAGRRQRAARAS